MMFAPDWYKERQKQNHEMQRTCWGFHAPELKKHPLCDRCLIDILQQIAVTERDRAIAFVQHLGFHDVAKRMRKELP
jgi:hypothetical protein